MRVVRRGNPKKIQHEEAPAELSLQNLLLDLYVLFIFALPPSFNVFIIMVIYPGLGHWLYGF